MHWGKEQRVDMQKEIIDTAIVVNPTFFFIIIIIFELVIFFFNVIYLFFLKLMLDRCKWIW